jgi:hypothetical protein
VWLNLVLDDGGYGNTKQLHLERCFFFFVANVLNLAKKNEKMKKQENFVIKDIFKPFFSK